MSDAARAGFGFAVAAALLLVVADYQPKFALGLAALLGLGVALSHADQIATLLYGFANAAGRQSSRGA